MHGALAALAMACAWPVPRGHADLLRLVTGDRIKGVVVHEGNKGVWVEVAPRIAVFYDYDRVASAVRWDAARNAQLIVRPKAPLPITEEEMEGRVIAGTPKGLWVQVEPRMAKFIDHGTQPVRTPAAGAASGGVARRGPSPGPALRALDESRERLSTAQVVRRVGTPDRRKREDGQLRWEYDLGRGRVGIVYFRDGRLDYVDFVTRR